MVLAMAGRGLATASAVSSSGNSWFSCSSSPNDASNTPYYFGSRPCCFHHHASIHRINACVLTNQSSFFAWEARSHLGSSSDLRAIARDLLRYPKGSPKGIVQASLFGVGAPEAVVIAVVALIVFGPKGLAEIARTLGKSLRAFQPTLRELQEVSKEFKNTLEQEMGLDELRSYDSKDPEKNVQSEQKFQLSANAKQNVPTENGAYTTEEYVRVTEEQTKVLVSAEQQQAAEAAAWGGTPPIINTKAADQDNNGSDGADNNMGTK